MTKRKQVTNIGLPSGIPTTFNMMRFTYGTHLTNYKTYRGGVIPYTILNGKVYFLLARHAETGELGDFGGGIKKVEFALNGSIREYTEETNGIFSKFYNSSNDFLDKLALVDGDKMVVIFVPIGRYWLQNENAQNAFVDSKSNGCKKSSEEISELVWVDEDRFAGLVNKMPRKCGFDRTRRNNWTKENVNEKDKLWKLVQNFFLKLDDVRTISSALKMMTKAD